MRDALRALQQRRREDALKLKALRAQIKAGVDALERGDFVEVDDADLEGFLEGLPTPSGEHAR
jgi:antitoxin ParD1/3/4